MKNAEAVNLIVSVIAPSALPNLSLNTKKLKWKKKSPKVSPRMKLLKTRTKQEKKMGIVKR